MRVLTSIGFGEVNAGQFAAREDPIEVTMENPDDPLGHRQIISRNAVYAFGDYAVIRVVVVEGINIPCSNVLPFSTLSEAVAFYDSPLPGGETRLLLNLKEGIFQSSQPIGALAGPYFRVSPWLDRWALEYERPELEGIETMADAMKAFNNELETCGGTSGGIKMEILLDLEKQRVVRAVIFVLANRGAVYNQQYEH
jgi:hypothetical protein